MIFFPGRMCQTNLETKMEAEPLSWYITEARPTDYEGSYVYVLDLLMSAFQSKSSQWQRWNSSRRLLCELLSTDRHNRLLRTQPCQATGKAWPLFHRDLVRTRAGGFPRSFPGAKLIETSWECFNLNGFHSLVEYFQLLHPARKRELSSVWLWRYSTLKKKKKDVLVTIKFYNMMGKSNCHRFQLSLAHHLRTSLCSLSSAHQMIHDRWRCATLMHAISSVFKHDHVIESQIDLLKWIQVFRVLITVKKSIWCILWAVVWSTNDEN